MLVCIVSCSQAKYYPNCYNPRDCELPDCYCKYEDIPGGIPQRDTPQMILFTYSGALPKRVCIQGDIQEYVSRSMYPGVCIQEYVSRVGKR